MRSSECPPNDNNVNDDAIARVLGRDKRGQVRGLGFGVTPSKIDGQIHSEQKVRVLELKLKETNDMVAKMQEMMAQVMKQNEEVFISTLLYYRYIFTRIYVLLKILTIFFLVIE